MHDDYEWERDFGCVGWNWETARKTFSAMPDVLHDVQPGEAGQVDDRSAGREVGESVQSKRPCKSFVSIALYPTSATSEGNVS